VHAHQLAVAAEPKGSCRAEVAALLTEEEAGSLKTEEKTKSDAIGTKGGKPTTFELETTDPTVHQLGTGSNGIGRMPIVG
jgi:hypothetical protein